MNERDTRTVVGQVSDVAHGPLVKCAMFSLSGENVYSNTNNNQIVSYTILVVFDLGFNVLNKHSFCMIGRSLCFLKR